MTLSIQQQPPYRVLRQTQSRSIENLAAAAEIDPAHLSRIERGLAEPTLPVFYRLARALGQRELCRMLDPYIGDRG